MTTEPSTSTADKAAAFQALHREPGTFVIANAWDGGSARLLRGLGFADLAIVLRHRSFARS